MKNTNLNGKLALASILASAAITSKASAHDLDVWVSFDNGAIQIGSADKGETPVEFTAGVRVFEAEFGELPAFPNLLDEPGFYTETLPAGAGIGFNILGGLREWGGSNFDALSDQSMSIYQELDLSGSVAVTPANLNDTVPGFVFVEADNTGFFDEHPVFVLEDQQDGIYLLTLEVFTDVDGIANSEPLYIVFGSNTNGTLGDDEAFEAAIEEAVDFANANLVPTPGAAGILGVAGLAAIRRRRAR